MIESIFKRAGECPTIYWNEWADNEIMEFELLNHCGGLLLNEGRSTYYIFFAVTRKDIEKSAIPAGTFLQLRISLRSFDKAIEKLPSEMTIPVNERNSKGKNLLLHIERLNSKAMKIHFMSVRDITDINVYAKAEKKYEEFRKKHYRNGLIRQREIEEGNDGEDNSQATD